MSERVNANDVRTISVEDADSYVKLQVDRRYHQYRTRIMPVGNSQVTHQVSVSSHASALFLREILAEEVAERKFTMDGQSVTREAVQTWFTGKTN